MKPAASVTKQVKKAATPKKTVVANKKKSQKSVTPKKTAVSPQSVVDRIKKEVKPVDPVDPLQSLTNAFSGLFTSEEQGVPPTKKEKKTAKNMVEKVKREVAEKAQQKKIVLPLVKCRDPTDKYEYFYSGCRQYKKCADGFTRNEKTRRCMKKRV